MGRRKRDTRKEHGRKAAPTKVSHDFRPEAPALPAAAMWLLYVAVFLSAFLLFQLQPQISKAILPWFGGSPTTWTTCMLFFQVLLLAGYALAHLTVKHLTPRLQLIVYVIAAIAALLCLPVIPDEAWKPSGNEDPMWRILGVLASTVGAPFLLLSTHSTILQVWYHRSTRHTPYWLYALSNAGSLLGLLTYPSLIEPRFGIREQAIYWSILFGLLTVLVSVGGWFSRTAQGNQTANRTSAAMPRAREYLAWLGLSACGSVLLLAMTNHISQNVAVVPYLWVMPLALYLVTFILAFGSRRLYHRNLTGVAMAVALGGCAFFYNSDGGDSVPWMLTVHLAGMFCGCMVCHGELALRKPAPELMPVFYLVMSAGGALGGVMVNWIAPRIFFHYFEYPLVLTACWLIWMGVLFYSRSSRIAGGRPLWAWGMIACAFMLFLIQIRDGVIKTAANNIITRRDFFGVLSIKVGRGHDGADWVQLAHGSIVHGAQYVDELRKFEPTTYYAATSGLGVVMDFTAKRSARRVGVLGMGVGTIATYAAAGDTYRCYEIDPNVIQIATNPDIFSFWTLFAERGVEATTVIGDARVSLERELASGQRGQFDVLVLDVFTGDAVPVHLLTQEAFEVYWQHLTEDGILAINISNRYVDLLPVILAAAKQHQRELGIVIDPDRSEWLLLSGRRTFSQLCGAYPQRVLPVRRTDRSVLWTDDHSNLFSVLK